MVSPGGSCGKESACNVGDWGSIPGAGRSPGEGVKTHSSILVWRATVHGVAKSRTRVCVYEHISDVSLDSLEEHTNSVTWRVRLGRSDRGLHILFLIYLITIKMLGCFK